MAHLVKNRISAIYLPTEADASAAPLSIAVKQHMAPGGGTFESSVRSFAAAEVERIATPIGDVFRWTTDSTGEGELTGLRSRQVGYGYPLPGAGERRGMLFLSAIAYVDDTSPTMLAALTETSDTIMETFRWR